MEHIDSLVIVTVAALIHASFQLSVSVLTLLSSHTLGAKRSQAKLLSLIYSFTAGVAVMTATLLSFGAVIVAGFFGVKVPALLWVILCGLLFGLGVSVWLFYYRKEQGTSLWVPRGMARHLSERTKATKYSAEAFSLGLASVIGELLFIVAPLLVAVFTLAKLPAAWQLGGVVLYTVISLLSLLVITALVGSGHSISRIQKWREKNKLFLQIAAGTALFILGFYLYIDQVLTPAVMAAAGSV